MIRKRVIAAVGLIFVVVIAVSLFMRETGSNPDYIFDADSKISLKDVELARQPSRFPEMDADFLFDEENSGLPSGSTQTEITPKVRISGFVAEINYNTLKFFRYLHRSYTKSKNLEEHLVSVLDQLKSQLPEKDALYIYQLYQKYLQAEIDLANELVQWTPPSNPREVLDMLVKIQEFRRKMLGSELADALYGAEVKSSEYIMRRAIVVQDQDLYGAEKEQTIDLLNREMWGDDAEAIEQKPKPYHRYREKLKLYTKDLSELSGAEKKEKISEFRRSFFSGETITRLEKVDAQIDQEKESEIAYFQQASTIINNPDLSAEEKATAVGLLQENIFGDQAESFRRREAIRKGMEKLKSQAKAGIKPPE